MTAKVRLLAVLPVLTLLTACSTQLSGTGAVPSDQSVVATSPSSSAPTSSARSVRPTPAASTVTTTVTAAPSTAAATSSSVPPPTATAPVGPPTDLDGEVYGFVTAVDLAASQITLDKIDWFTGAAAQQACAEDGVTDTSNNQCTGHYFRNNNPALRVVAVSPQASITTLDGARSVPSDLATVASRLSSRSTYHLIVTPAVGHLAGGDVPPVTP